MRKKYLAVALCLVLSTACLAGCGTNQAAQTSAVEESVSAEAESQDLSGQTISGEITAIDGNTITLDDEISFEITENTAITREMGSMGEMDGSAAPENPGENTENAAGGDQAAVDPASGDQAAVDPANGGAAGGEAMTGEGTGETPPEKPDGDTSASGGAAGGEAMTGEGTGETPPEKPDGDTSASGGAAGGEAMTGEGTGETPPEKPDGDTSTADEGAAGGEAMTGGEAEQGDFDPNASLTVADLQVGDTIQVTFNDAGDPETITISGGDMSMGQPGGQSQGVESYDAVTEYTEDTEISGESYESTGTDENAIHVYNGAEVTLDGITVTQTSDSSTGGDNASFYGVGAAILNTDGVMTVSNATITTDAKGGAGVFSYGDGVTYVKDSVITTAEDTSGGIHVAGGGTLYASNLTVETSGESSAAIRSDRGGGTMDVDGGSYTSNGIGSPAVYCTADITVKNADLTANGSEAVCIEGLNSLSLTDCNLTGNMSDNEQNDCTWNVILYQSMSGDSEVGNSTFEMTGGTLTAKNGGMFYTTNTESTFTLENVDIVYADENDFFLKCTGNANARGWGDTGKNGAICTFTGIDQEMEGDVIWDTISQLDFSATEGSVLTGAIICDDSNAGNGGDGYCNVTIDADSSWIVTGDSTVSKLSASGTIQDAGGKTVTIKGTDGTVYVKGDSSYTITVDEYDA